MNRTTETLRAQMARSTSPAVRAASQGATAAEMLELLRKAKASK